MEPRVLLRSLLLASMVLILTPRSAHATAQLPDNLIVKGKERPILTNPLEDYFRKFPEKRPTSGDHTTSLWGGYIATWIIEDDKLLLTDVEVMKAGQDSEVSVIYDVFPLQRRIHATWYTGHIILPGGELVDYVTMGYGSTYERYGVLTIEEGVLTHARRMSEEDFREFRKKQWDLYKKTDEYMNELAKLKDKDGQSQEDREDFLFDFLSERYTNMIFNSESESAP